MIIAVIQATFAVAKSKPEKKIIILSRVYNEPIQRPAPRWLVSLIGRAMHRYRRGIRNLTIREPQGARKRARFSVIDKSINRC